MVDIIIACKLSFRLSPLVLPFRNRLMPTHVSYMFYTIPTQYIRMYIYIQCIHITYRHTDTIPGGHHTLFGRQAFAKNCFKKNVLRKKDKRCEHHIHVQVSHTCTILFCHQRYTRHVPSRHNTYTKDTILTQSHTDHPTIWKTQSWRTIIFIIKPNILSYIINAFHRNNEFISLQKQGHEQLTMMAFVKAQVNSC